VRSVIEDERQRLPVPPCAHAARLSHVTINGFLPLALGYDQDGPGTSVLLDARGWIQSQRLAVFQVSLQWRRYQAPYQTCRDQKRSSVRPPAVSGAQCYWRIVAFHSCNIGHQRAVLWQGRIGSLFDATFSLKRNIRTHHPAFLALRSWMEG
jgi:hypothetical protein